MSRARLWKCQFTGHQPDLDWPVETPLVKTPTGKYFAFALARCANCGCFYSLKMEAEAPTGLVGANGAPIMPTTGNA